MAQIARVLRNETVRRFDAPPTVRIVTKIAAHSVRAGVMGDAVSRMTSVAARAVQSWNDRVRKQAWLYRAELMLVVTRSTVVRPQGRMKSDGHGGPLPGWGSGRQRAVAARCKAPGARRPTKRDVAI